VPTAGQQANGRVSQTNTKVFKLCILHGSKELAARATSTKTRVPCSMGLVGHCWRLAVFLS